MERQIIIKSLTLTNCKGIRELEVEFNDTITSVFGRNGSGKTTLFDAFTYVLFGKDSKDRKDFNIKTLDADNKTIPKLPHEVKCVLSVNGQEIELRRCYCEKWTKKRGSATEEFTGNGEERYYNGVPCSVKEYDAKVAEICNETVFKFITNPLYFTSQKKDIQRAMLFRMAGEISDAEIAKGNTDFENLLDKLTGKTLEEYKREIGAKKKTPGGRKSENCCRWQTSAAWMTFRACLRRQSQNSWRMAWKQSWMMNWATASMTTRTRTQITAATVTVIKHCGPASEM